MKSLIILSHQNTSDVKLIKATINIIFVEKYSLAYRHDKIAQNIKVSHLKIYCMFTHFSYLINDRIFHCILNKNGRANLHIL